MHQRATDFLKGLIPRQSAALGSAPKHTMSLVEDPDPLVGQTLAGRYRVRRKLEQGGMGAIYIATQEPLGREVALKLLRREYADDATALGRFEKEARAASALAHPHIVTIYDFGQTGDGHLFLAMEYLRGRSLRRLLDDEGRMSWRRSLRVIRGIASGLVEAHRHGIMHRDLKPENVMLVRAGDDDDFVKILDFGLARSVQRDDDVDARLTQKDVIPGTPNYMPPERINGKDDDLRSDLYAIGAVWFELLTGRIPFAGESAVRILVRHMQDPPPRPSEHGAGASVPAVVDDLVLRLLAKSPADRPPSADALLKELSRVDGSEGWAVASTGDIAREATHTPDVVQAWASEPSVDLDFAAIPPVSAPEEGAIRDDQPIALTRRKGGPRSSPPPDDTSLDAIMLLTKKKAPPPPPRSAISSLSDAAMRISRAGSLDEVGAVTVDFLRARFDRAALVDLRANPPRVVDAWGLSPRVQLEAAVAGFPPLHAAIATGEAYYGPPHDDDGWLEFHQRASGAVPAGVLFAALRRGGRAALLVYAEHDRAALDVDLGDLGRLLRELAASLTTLRF